ncbi:uncharacterized protein E0L32_008596 [Thyridium curvatum]|uniref:Uncharacterized protein n=1 Tax=Thyridium curvatum TaxID=1093900 RepID=A0A507ASC9_9PEZI|nr:uncharacterized protein E0L32_008596 [Thyridium curvatum]TPX10377.1 hypothetical protein E0L32_008596 [Thyridium curvatum]
MTSMLDIKGRVAAVTGASSGNGREIALTLATAGAHLEDTSTPTHELIASRNYQTIYQEANVSSEEDVKLLVEAAVHQYGCLDIFVNNAGIFCGLANIVNELVVNFDKTMEPSYCASTDTVVQLTRQVAVDYAKEKIHVNAVCPGFLSTAMVRPFLENPETRKMLLSKSPWPHLGSAQDVGKTVLILASDAASWMTGSLLQVDGGFIAQ